MAMDENFDWDKFERDETERILSEMETIERNKPQNAAVCLNHADESTLEAFEKAVRFSIGPFTEATKNLR